MIRPSSTPRTITLLAVVVLVLAGMRLVLPHPGGKAPAPDAVPAPEASPPRPDAEAEAAVAWAERFLDRHVGDDGRVVHTDQGGDTVSEGQAWALLVAVAVDDEERAATIARWTEANLAGDDGLLAWRWAEGEVVDATPATDADLVHAWALAMGADAFNRPDWDRRATEVLTALDTAATVDLPDGPLLAAGPWALDDDGAVVNPSYLWPAALRFAEDRAPVLDGALAAATDLFDRLVHDTTPLVPDWLHVDGDGTPTSTGPPSDPGAPPQHGLDAVRTWLWLGTDCDPDVRALAAPAHDRFAADPTAVVAVHDLGGAGTVEWRHAATLAGAAGAAHAAGDDAATRARLATARSLEERHPSYYGAAVTALAGLLLDTGRVHDCA